MRPDPEGSSDDVGERWISEDGDRDTVVPSDLAIPPSPPSDCSHTSSSEYQRDPADTRPNSDRDSSGSGR
jgi:hypothetical protein